MQWHLVTHSNAWLAVVQSILAAYEKDSQPVIWSGGVRVYCYLLKDLKGLTPALFH